jgi:hypothetical protein
MGLFSKKVPEIKKQHWEKGFDPYPNMNIRYFASRTSNGKENLFQYFYWKIAKLQNWAAFKLRFSGNDKKILII